MSLKLKLVVVSVLAASTVLLGLGGFQYFSGRREMHRALEATVSGASTRLAATLAAPLWNVSKDQAIDVLKVELSIPDVLAIVVKRDDGSAFAAVGRKDGQAVEVEADAAPRAGTRSSAFDVLYEGKKIGTGEIVYTDELLTQRLRRQALLTLFQTALVDAILVAALLVVVTTLVLRPLRSLTAEAARLRESVQNGDLAVRGDPAQLAAEFRPPLEGMNATMDAFTRPLRLTVDYLDRISKGDLPPAITDRYDGDFNDIKNALNRCIEAVAALVQDAGALARAGVEGRLATRADASRHAGEFRAVVEGMNATLDAVVKPLQGAAQVVARIAKGDIPPAMAEDWKGDFAELRDNLNRCTAALSTLLDRIGGMVSAQEAGDIDAFLDEKIFEGAYQKVAVGTNECVRSHIRSILQILEVIGAYGEGNFEPELPEYKGKRIIATQRVNLVRANLRALAAEVQKLSGAAVQGRLDVRADASRFKGDWGTLLDGLNRTLDALSAPVNDAARVLEQLAGRDLCARITADYSGDHARVKDAVNAMAGALHDAMSQVALAVEQVSSASAQIAASSQAVASGASEQAAAIQQTTSSIESVGGTTRHTADSAQQANTLAQASRAAATDGSAAVEQMQGAMARIKASAEGTSQIIRDINDIAFQTNLLALNAAVEAARAGEAGRGFAVVAEEVRSLALRAKEAATKTEELIRQSVKEAGDGEVTSRLVGAKLVEIAGGVANVTDIVGEITAAAREQAAGVEQVSRAVAEMDKVTQQNAASAEESSSAASELSGQAEELAAMVSTFRLERTQANAATRAARRPRALPRPADRPAVGPPPRWSSGKEETACSSPPLGEIEAHPQVQPFQEAEIP